MQENGVTRRVGTEEVPNRSGTIIGGAGKTTNVDVVNDKIGRIETRLLELKDEDLNIELLNQEGYQEIIQRNGISIRDLVRVRVFEHLVGERTRANELKAQNEKLQMELTQVSGELEKSIINCSTLASLLTMRHFIQENEEIGVQKKQYALLKVDVVHSQKELDRLREEGESTKANQEKSEQEQRKKQQIVLSLTREAEDLRKSLEELTGSYKQVIGETKEANSKIRDLEAQIRRLKTELMSTNDKLLQTHGIIKEKEFENKKITNKLKANERRFNELVDKSTAALHKYESVSDKFLGKMSGSEEKIEQIKVNRDEIAAEMLRIVLTNVVDDASRTSALSHARSIIAEESNLTLEQLVAQIEEQR